MEIFTIGFTRKSAGEFFESLRAAGIRRLIDVRLNNTSQLAAFAKRDDLAYFLQELCGADYLHMPDLAPSTEILDAYKTNALSWEEYESRFLEILAQREIERSIQPDLLATPTVLLCSEPTADRCHRRLVAEYLRSKWSGVKITHL